MIHSLQYTVDPTFIHWTGSTLWLMSLDRPRLST